MDPNITTAIIAGVPAVVAAALAYRSSSQAAQATVTVNRVAADSAKHAARMDEKKVDAEAYEAAQQIYKRALEQAEREVERLQGQMERMRSQMDQLKAQVDDGAAENDALRRKVSSLERTITTMEATISSLRLQLGQPLS